MEMRYRAKSIRLPAMASVTVPSEGREGNGTAILENLLAARQVEDGHSPVTRDSRRYSRETLAQVK